MVEYKTLSERYKSMSDRAIRNKPETDEIETAYANMLAQDEANKIIDRLRDEPVFLTAVTKKLAEHVLSKREG